MTVERFRARHVVTPSGAATWTVCDSDGLPVQDVDDFLHWLRARPCSVNTLKAYSVQLAALFTWLSAHAMEWHRAEFRDLADFMSTYRNGLHPLSKRGAGPRSVATMRLAAASLREFYEYHRTERTADLSHLVLTRHLNGAHHANQNHFLAHIEARGTVAVNRFSSAMPPAAPNVRTIGFESDFCRMLAASRSARDRLALSAMYDLGLRVGQTLGLRHEDLDVRRRTVRIVRREDNVNGALSKRKAPLEVPEGNRRFFDLYRDYLLNELIPRDIDSDYVFVNLDRKPVGSPLTADNLGQQVRAIGRRAGIGHVTPHMLRHTHATALAKQGWTSAEIAARLGQAFSGSADVYIHLASSDVEARLRETASSVWRLSEGTAQE